jgi:HK97 family phage prohead protease
MKTNFEALLNFDKSYVEEDLEKHTPSKADWIVEGYAATSDLDSQNHIINQDAINMGAESLKKYETVLFNHDSDRPIGVIKYVEPQSGKLFVKVKISKSEPKIWQQVQDGTLSKFSIRGRITDSEVKRDEFNDKSILVIKGMELHEISLVSVPANVNAKSLSYYVEKSLSFPQEDEVTFKISTKSLAKTIVDSIKENISEFLNIEKKDYKQKNESLASCVSRKTRANINEGMPPKQAVAAAYSMCGETKKADELILEDVFETLSKDLTEDEMKEFKELFTIYSKSLDDQKGGKEMADEKKVEEVKTEEVKKTDEVKTEEVTKSVEKEVTLNVGALKDVILQLQELAKSVTTQSDTVKTLVDTAKKDSEAIAKTKDEIVKVFEDLNALTKQIPLRKGQSAEAEKVEERKDEVEKDFTKNEDYKKLNPMDKIHKIFSMGLEINK